MWSLRKCSTVSSRWVRLIHAWRPLTLSQDFLVTRLIWVLHWLDSWPAGLKLNTELSRFYAHSFSEIISAWGGKYVLDMIWPVSSVLQVS